MAALHLLSEDIMGHKIEVTRLDLSARKLRRLASQSQDGRVACRALAIAHVREGSSPVAAAAACGMDRQTLRDWVHRYNDDGLDGLSDGHRSGRPPVLSAMQMTSPGRAAAAAAEGMRKVRPGPTSRIRGCADSAVGKISISRAIGARRMSGHDPSGRPLDVASNVLPPRGMEVMRDGLAMRRLRRMAREMREALRSIIPRVLAWNAKTAVSSGRAKRTGAARKPRPEAGPQTEP